MNSRLVYLSAGYLCEVGSYELPIVSSARLSPAPYPCRRSGCMRTTRCLCFADINPQAPTRLPIVPTEHIASTAHAEAGARAAAPDTWSLKAAEMWRAARGLDRGYRIVINTGQDGGQTVDHHLHLPAALGGVRPRPPGWVSRGIAGRIRDNSSMRRRCPEQARTCAGRAEGADQ